MPALAESAGEEEGHAGRVACCDVYIELVQVQELEVIDEVDQPAITIRKPDMTGEITEKRQGGIVEEIKVKSGPSTYYLYPNGPGGVPGSFESSEVRPALWKIHEFDIGEAPQEKQQQEMNEPLNAPPLPPPSMNN